jgi:hypothetical protein
MIGTRPATPVVQPQMSSSLSEIIQKPRRSQTNEIISQGEFHWFVHTTWFVNTPWFVRTTWFIHTIWFSQSTWFVNTTTFSTFPQIYPRRAQHQCQQLPGLPQIELPLVLASLQAYPNLVTIPLRSKAGRFLLLPTLAFLT